MSINQKARIAIVATLLMPLTISSAANAGIFRPSCTENNRGVGDVSGTASKNEVLLYWDAPGYVFQGIHVCYKKNWALVGKCDGGKHAYKNYGGYVSGGDILITGLDKNSCYKFAVYGTNDGLEELVGEEKIKTSR
jgi:hypothetical protein